MASLLFLLLAPLLSLSLPASHGREIKPYQNQTESKGRKTNEFGLLLELYGQEVDELFRSTELYGRDHPEDEYTPLEASKSVEHTKAHGIHQYTSFVERLYSYGRGEKSSAEENRMVDDVRESNNVRMLKIATTCYYVTGGGAYLGNCTGNGLSCCGGSSGICYPRCGKKRCCSAFDGTKTCCNGVCCPADRCITGKCRRKK